MPCGTTPSSDPTCLTGDLLGGQESIFGFGDALTALTLIIVFYTFTDARYRFRLALAPFPMEAIGFGVLAVVGALSLIVDTWFAMGWPVYDFLGRQVLWQAALAAAILIVIVAWVYQGFVHPPTFTHANAKEYFGALYRLMLRGTDDEMKMVANELSRSGRVLVRLARNEPEAEGASDPAQLYKQEKAETGSYASHVLLLMGSRKLCRYIIASSPVTAMIIFDEMTKLQKTSESLGPFSVNVSTEAISNKDSPLYHEGSGYYEGLMGYWRPFTKALYGEYETVRGLGDHNRSPLDVAFDLRRSWDGDQFEAYCGAVLTTFKSYLKSRYLNSHSTSLYRAIDDIAKDTFTIYKIEGMSEGGYDSREFKVLSAAVDFLQHAIEAIDKLDVLPRAIAHKGDERRHTWQLDVFDWIARAMFEILFHTTAVTKPIGLSWWVQHNKTWSDLFNNDSPAWRIVHHKLRRLLYNEAREFGSSPNFKNAKMLGLCLHVMGPKLHNKSGYGRQWYSLHKLILPIAKANFMKVYRERQPVAEACLMGNLTLDIENRRLVKTYASMLGKEGARDFLVLDEPPAESQVDLRNDA